jgi:hypothetical protein
VLPISALSRIEESAMEQRTMPAPSDDSYKGLCEMIVTLQRELRGLRAEVERQHRQAIGANVVNELMDRTGELVSEVERTLRGEIAALRERLDHISKPRAADTARGLFAMVDDPTEAELKAFETLARASNYRTLRIATALIGLVEHAALDCGSDERHYIGRLLVRIGRKILHQVQER